MWISMKKLTRKLNFKKVINKQNNFKWLKNLLFIRHFLSYSQINKVY